MDFDAVDEILFRRHTGSQDGVGQSHWDETAKTNFINRTGKNSKVHVADEVERKLRNLNLIDEKSRLPRSNLNRLLSSEALRNRVGITVSHGAIEFTHHEEKVLRALQRISSDLIGREKTLEDIWDNKGKKAYLDSLEREGVLPSAKDALPIASDFKKFRPQTPMPRQRAIILPTDPNKRTTLIPKNVTFSPYDEAVSKRFLLIWAELQNELFLDRHAQAISVLFRVLLELAIQEYVQRHRLKSRDGDALKVRFKNVADHLFQMKHLDFKSRETLQKFESNDSMISANTMNQYVHSSNFFPSPEHLRPMWDNLERFIIFCVTR